MPRYQEILAATFPGKETKIFDPADGFAPLADLFTVTDATVAKRADRWWMFLAGKAASREGIQLFSASLPQGAALAATGWRLTFRARRFEQDRRAGRAGRERSVGSERRTPLPFICKGLGPAARRLGRENLLRWGSRAGVGPLHDRLSTNNETKPYRATDRRTVHLVLLPHP